MSHKACDGEATITVGDMEECAECGTRVRHDLTDDAFWGFHSCREKSVTALCSESASSENAGATPVDEAQSESAQSLPVKVVGEGSVPLDASRRAAIVNAANDLDTWAMRQNGCDNIILPREVAIRIQVALAIARDALVDVRATNADQAKG